MSTLMYSFLAGLSTSLGAVILMIFGEPSEKILAILIGFAAGIMTAISVFELLPEALELSSLTNTVVAFILGALLMYSFDKLLPHSHLSSAGHLVTENPEKLKVQSPLLRTGFLIFLGIALHNLPEGLAIGAGFESSPEAGMYIAMAIGLHNIPEGLAIAGPLKSGGASNTKILLFTLFAGLMIPLGTIIAQFFFNISALFVGASLAFAAGAMLYIVNDELIPQSNNIHSHFANAGILIGILMGFMIL
ncbi:ZIP family metal transporter [Halanaerobium hydrogeniformans]|uniref:Zinc/iron permease n=1 Tax=Halanaerobium hydrogeniformans TaxID=656519 RepID=E4RK05_HALHG|nr:ZIP family metal transporter [Halanaerobium hydrogeniformans]ADQ15575.1 zinc/iron permease [Halanaerobium hydrogeniformans]